MERAHRAAFLHRVGHLADRTSIEYKFQLCAYLPLLGLFTVFLPDIESDKSS